MSGPTSSLCSTLLSCVFDSLREIMAYMQAEARKLCHLGITTMPSRSTLSYANKCRPEFIFETIYCDLYTTYRNVLCSDKHKNRDRAWMKCLHIIVSTIITLFYSLFQGGGVPPKKRQREKRYKSTHSHTCQRKRLLRHKVHFRHYQRFFYVKTLNTEQR